VAPQCYLLKTWVIYG